MSCLESYFGAVPDPRAANATHRLGDLIVMMVAASLCGATNATEFSLFAQERKQALSRLIAYEEAPSHDTFSRLLRLLDPEAFGRAFAAFAAGFAQACQGVVSLDSKALRRAYEKGLAASPPLTVSAFAAETRLCLAAASPGDAENEVEAALKVVELIDLTGRLVTADALHCHTRMAKPSPNAAATICSRSRETAGIGLAVPTSIWSKLSPLSPSGPKPAMAVANGGRQRSSRHLSH